MLQELSSPPLSSRGILVRGDRGSVAIPPQAAELDDWVGRLWSDRIDYTAHLAALMADIVARVPTLGFIDLDRVLVFARPGRSSADGPFASCHCLRLPDSDPGYYFWSDRHSGAITRCSQWFVTRSPEVTLHGRRMNYLISFALPRFPDQSLSRSRKRLLYPKGTPDWVAKLDTVVHELYHVDPDQQSLRRFRRPDGTESDALHSPTYFQDVAALVMEYLGSAPDPARLEFLRHDFAALRDAFGGVAATTFRGFPSYPRRYREPIGTLPLPAHLSSVPVEPVGDAGVSKRFTSDDLQLREFSAGCSRLVADRTRARAA